MSPSDRPSDSPSSNPGIRSSSSTSGTGSSMPAGGADAEFLPSSKRSKLDLSLPRVVGGALAAASAAIASSQLGVAGTVIGAVLASVVISVGTALYTRPIERTSQVLRETLPVRADRSRLAPEPTDDVPAPSGATAWKQRWPVGRARRTTASDDADRARRRMWAAAAVSTLATLALTFALLTGLEQVTGKPVSSWTGHGSRSGTTLGRIIDPGAQSSPTSGSSGSNAPQHEQQPAGPSSTTPQPTPSTVTVTVPTTPAPTTSSPSTTPSPSTPTPSTPTPSTAPPSSPSPTPTTTPTRPGLTAAPSPPTPKPSPNAAAGTG